MSFKLPNLPYSYDALEPYIDAKTMEIHHGKHHAAYVDNLNAVLKDHKKFLNMDLKLLLENINEVPDAIMQTVINNAGGHANHSFFWKIMSPAKLSGEPYGKFLTAVNEAFGNFDNFRVEFTKKAMSVFGSGWAFLMADKSGKLSLKRHSFQNSPLMHGNVPILGIDVWEHAYYLKYQNRRPEYIEAWWNIVNWDEVGKIFSSLH